MKTINPNEDEMRSRISRYSELTPMHSDLVKGLPQEAADIFISPRICAVIAPANLTEGPFANPAPITDADFSMSIAMCPAGRGPSLHVHRHTTETFTCLEGRFRFYWGDEGQFEVVLEKYDTFSVPPNVCRGFECVGPEDGYLQVIVTGEVSNMDDIEFPAATEDKLRKISPEAVDAVKKMGARFIPREKS